MRWRNQFEKFSTKRKGAKPQRGNILFEQFLESKKRALRKLVRPTKHAGRFNTKRRARVTSIRKILNCFKDGPSQQLSPQVLCFRLRKSLLADAWVPNRTKQWLKPLDRARQGVDFYVELKDFSLLDHPEASLIALKRIARLELGARSIRVHFDDLRCLDIASYLVLTMLWRDMTPLFNGGRMNPEIMEVLEAVQVRSLLRMKRIKVPYLEETNVLALPIQQRRPANTSSSINRMADIQTRERVQDSIVKYINTWLSHPLLQKQLTDIGAGSIKNITGEILDNAERHSDPSSQDGDWSVAGFMARRRTNSGVEYFQCSIAFISLGKSISESLETSAPEVGSLINEYVRSHRANCDGEVLRTIMAIQDGITRDPAAAEIGRGGTGFQEVLELVHGLSDGEIEGVAPKVTILSGRACLKLHAGYGKGIRKNNDPLEPRQIWFNEDNSELIQPDPSSAILMPIKFPGTLVTMSFPFIPVPKD